MNHTWKNRKKKLILDPILACLAQIWTHKIFLEVLPLPVS